MTELTDLFQQPCDHEYESEYMIEDYPNDGIWVQRCRKCHQLRY